ncbi:hypothetical protein HYY74_01775 [Candidatus Woesearchaeota archaeon]|nr:hypothetical protein [Candidatus Woesearchaeota archaeon]
MDFLGQKRAAFLICLLAGVLFAAPVLSNIQNWGGYDWDQHFFYHGSAWISMVKYWQIPLWNPFYCGGSPLLANPQSTFLSPFFLPVLFFGPVTGLKIELIVYLVLGLFGMFLLARKLGTKALPAYLAAGLFMFSSWFTARVAVGHTTFLPFALLPWAVLFFLEGYTRRLFLLASAAVLAVMFLSGGIYPFYFTCMFLALYAALDGVERKSFKPVILVAAVLVLALGISAVKLIPMLQFTGGLSAEDSQYSSFGMLVQGLAGREQKIPANDAATGRGSLDGEELVGATLQGKVAWGWHEYSAYIGILGLVLVLLSVILYRKTWKLLVIGFAFLVLSLGDYSPIPAWQIIKEIPVIGALHGPSRLLILFVFCASLLATKSLSDIKPINRHWISAIIIVLVLADLMLVSRPLLYNAFDSEPLQINPYEHKEYVHLAVADQFKSQYPNMLQNLDTVNCYERVHPRIRAVPQFYDNGEPYPGFIGNAYIAETNKTYNLSFFSPNKVVVEGIDEPGTLVYNQNYLPGWNADGQPAISHGGLVAARVTRQEKVEFTYLPSTFYISLALSLLSLLIGGFICWKWQQ